MKHNMGKIDRAIRLVVGFVLLSPLFVLAESAHWWGLAGAVLLAAPVLVRWSGLYSAHRSNSRELSMRGWILLAAAYAGIASAQAPVENGPQPPDPVLSAQQKAGMAYHDWQDAQAAHARAEEEFKQAAAAYQAAQQQLNDTKQRAETAQKKLEAAETQEIATRKTYDKAVASVDRILGNKAPYNK
jgi:hypothetical protein